MSMIAYSGEERPSWRPNSGLCRRGPGFGSTSTPLTASKSGWRAEHQMVSTPVQTLALTPLD